MSLWGALAARRRAPPGTPGPRGYAQACRRPWLQPVQGPQYSPSKGYRCRPTCRTQAEPRHCSHSPPPWWPPPSCPPWWPWDGAPPPPSQAPAEPRPLLRPRRNTNVRTIRSTIRITRIVITNTLLRQEARAACLTGLARGTATAGGAHRSPVYPDPLSALRPGEASGVLGPRPAQRVDGPWAQGCSAATRDSSGAIRVRRPSAWEIQTRNRRSSDAWKQRRCAGTRQVRHRSVHGESPCREAGSTWSPAGQAEVLRRPAPSQPDGHGPHVDAASTPGRGVERPSGPGTGL